MQQFQVDFLMKAAFSKHTDYLETDRSTLPISGYGRISHWSRWVAMPGLESLLFKSSLSSMLIHRTGAQKPPLWTTMAMEEFAKRKQTRSEKPNEISEEKPDLMDKYLYGADRHKEKVSDETILRMIVSTISAGFDTSAYTMTVILYYLLKDPTAMKKQMSEITDGLKAGVLSNETRFTEVDKLPYLAAVIKETMRLRPVLDLLLEREVPREGAEIAGKFIPGGTTVGVPALVAHFDTTVFGKDAEAFRPERWIEADHEQKVLMEKTVLGFGAGKRVCLGRHIAELEIKKVIPRLLMEFDVSLVSPESGRRPEPQV